MHISQLHAGIFLVMDIPWSHACCPDKRGFTVMVELLEWHVYKLC